MWYISGGRGIAENGEFLAMEEILKVAESELVFFLIKWFFND